MKKMIFALYAAFLLFAGRDIVTAKTAYGIGDTGPGGGVVFYDDKAGYDFDEDGTVQGDEKNLMRGYRYLEAAPSGWGGGSYDPSAAWGADGADIATLTHVSGSDADTLAGTVGDGRDSTAKIVAYLSGSETGRAAQLADGYTGGGKSDWFLPSVGELVILYSERDTVGGFSSYYYWSSSGYYSGSAWSVHMNYGDVNDYLKSYDFYVRPVRAFN